MNNSANRFSPPGQPSVILRYGYPIAIVLLLALQSTSYARDAFTVVILGSLWLDKGRWKAAGAQLIQKPSFLAGLALISLVSISAFWSQPPTTHAAGEQVRNGITVALFWMASCIYFYQDDNAMKRLFWAMCAGIMANLVGAWSTGMDLFAQGNRLGGYNVLINPNLLGPVTAITIAMGLHLKLSTLHDKIATIIMLLLGTLIVGLTVSRGALAALAAIYLIWFLYTPLLEKKNKLLIATALACLATLFIYESNLFAILAERGMSLRPVIWQETLRFVSQHWLIGWGSTNDFSQTVFINSEKLNVYGYVIPHAHNLLISALYYTGIIGLLMHLLFLIAIARDAFQSSNRSLALGLVTAILLATAVDTYTVITKRDYIFLLFWMPTALIVVRSLNTGFSTSIEPPIKKAG